MATKPKGILGNYATNLNVTLTESAANTLTFEKVESGMSIYDRVGWVLNRVEWMVAIASMNLILDQSDGITCGVATSNSMSSVSDTDPNILFRTRISQVDNGTPATSELVVSPIVQDFSGMPGGGILVLPNPLYVFVLGQSLASAVTVSMRAWFTSVELSDDDYFLLAQVRMLLTQ